MTEHYRILFVEANGPRPWPCYGCGEDVMNLIVHHIDGNHDNDAIENLAAVHPGCHMRLHRLGSTHSDETRAKMSASHRGKTKNSSHREKIRTAKLGKKRGPMSEEQRVKISNALRGRKLTKQHRQKIGDSNRGKVRSSS